MVAEYRVWRWGGCAAMAASLVLAAGCCCGGSSKDTEYSDDFRAVEGVNIFYQPQRNLGIRTVALVPFRAPTELIGSSVSDMFVTEILKSNRYRLVERSQISQVLGETELALAGVSNAKAMEVGQMTGADAVITGTVSEYEMMAYKGNKFPTVGVSIRCIDSKSGEILWSADYSKRGDDKNVSLSEHARRVVHSICATLYQRGLKVKR